MLAAFLANQKTEDMDGTENIHSQLFSLPNTIINNRWCRRVPTA